MKIESVFSSRAGEYTYPLNPYAKARDVPDVEKCICVVTGGIRTFN